MNVIFIQYIYPGCWVLQLSLLNFSLLLVLAGSFLHPSEYSSVEQSQTGGVQRRVLHQPAEVIELSPILQISGQSILSLLLLLAVPLVHDVPVVEVVLVVVEPEPWRASHQVVPLPAQGTFLS